MFKRSAIPEGRPWCCHGFEDMYARAGLRGVGVVVSWLDGCRPSFHVQFRTVDKGLESTVKMSPSTQPPLIATEMGLRFCPACGVFLEDFYGETIEGLFRPGLAIEL